MPRCSSTSSWTIFGIWNSMRLVRVAKAFLSLGAAGGRPGLLRVKLDDQGFLDGRVDLRPLRPLQDLAGEPLVVGLQPGCDRGREVGRVADRALGRAPRAH